MNKGAIKLIEWYQKRYLQTAIISVDTPTCSAYAKTAYTRFNFIKASFLTTKRVLTCNPLFKPKYDPVPEKIKNKSKLSE